MLSVPAMLTLAIVVGAVLAGMALLPWHGF